MQQIKAENAAVYVVTICFSWREFYFRTFLFPILGLGFVEVVVMEPIWNIEVALLSCGGFDSTVVD